MRLSHALAPHVSLRIRSRGAEYFASGAVVRIQRHDGIIRATVRGADDYSVWIEPVGPLLRSACTCPDFVDRLEICKHVWAAILTAEARGIPLLDTGHTPDQIDLEPMDLDDPYGEDEEAWRDQDERSHPAQAALPRKPRDTPVWRQFLDAIAASPNAPAGLAGPGVRESQLLYVLDISASRIAEWTFLRRVPWGGSAGHTSQSTTARQYLFDGELQNLTMAVAALGLSRSHGDGG